MDNNTYNTLININKQRRKIYADRMMYYRYLLNPKEPLSVSIGIYQYEMSETELKDNELTEINLIKENDDIYEEICNLEKIIMNIENCN